MSKVATQINKQRCLGPRRDSAAARPESHAAPPARIIGPTLGFGLLVNLLVLYALGLPVTLTAGLVMLLAGYAVGLVPSGPAQIGVFELAVAAPLTVVGLAMPTAVTAALGLHLVLLAMLALGGLLALPLGLQSRTVPPAARDQSLVRSGRLD